MTPEIKNIDAIHVIGARETGSYAEAAPKAWGRIMKFGYSNRLMAKSVRSIGISHDDPKTTNPNHIRYDACLDVCVCVCVNVHNRVRVCVRVCMFVAGNFRNIFFGPKYKVFLCKQLETFVLFL